MADILYWDSCAFLAWLNAEPENVAACTDTLNQAKNGDFITVTSALTITEVLWLRKGPKLSEEKGKKLNKFFRRAFLRIANVDRKIAESAQKQVWNNGIKPKDAIHVATALARNCSILETFDKGLLRKNNKFDDLEIRTPQEAIQSRMDLGDG